MAHEQSIDQPSASTPLVKRARKATTGPANGPVVNAEHSAVVAEIVARDSAILDRLAEA